MSMGRDSVLNKIYCVGWCVMLELLRRKYLHVMGALVGIFCIGAIGIRLAGVDGAIVAGFVLNLGLSIAYGLAHMVTLLLAIRQLPDEMQNKTIYPILGRPVSRWEVLLGKWAASALAGMIAYVLFVLMVCLATPGVDGTSGLLFGQMVMLHLLSIGLVAAQSVMMSLLVPKGMAVLVVALSVFGSGTIIGLVKSVVAGSLMDGVVQWLLLYLPDFGRLNLVTRYTDGMLSLGGPMVLGLILYAAVHISVCLSIGFLLFRRKSL